MERKKTAFSKLFDIVDGIENVVLVIMVIGMVVTIMIHRTYYRTSKSMDGRNQQIFILVDDVCCAGSGI